MKRKTTQSAMSVVDHLQKVIATARIESVGLDTDPLRGDSRIVEALDLYNLEKDKANQIAKARRGGATHRTFVARQRAEINRMLRAPDAVRYSLTADRLRVDTRLLLTALHDDNEDWTRNMVSGKGACRLALLVLSKTGSSHPVDGPMRNLLLRLLAIYAADHGDAPNRPFHPPITMSETSPLRLWLSRLRLPGMPTFGKKAVLTASREYRATKRLEDSMLNQEDDCEFALEDS